MAAEKKEFDNFDQMYFASQAPLFVIEAGTHWGDAILGIRGVHQRPGLILECEPMYEVPRRPLNISKENCTFRTAGLNISKKNNISKKKCTFRTADRTPHPTVVIARPEACVGSVFRRAICATDQRMEVHTEYGQRGFSQFC
jgi:hypothetical protein